MTRKDHATRELGCGCILRVPIGTVAARAAEWIMEYASNRAVTLDPEGRVWIEPVATCAESDLVGVYSRTLGLLQLTRQLSADLQHEKEARGLVRRNQRRVVNAQTRRAA